MADFDAHQAHTGGVTPSPQPLAGLDGTTAPAPVASGIMASIAEVPIWMFGVALVMAQAAFSATGLALQRYAKLRDDPTSIPGQAAAAGAAANPEKHQRKIKRLKLFGMILYGASQPLNAVAVTICPISVVGPLCSGSIIVFSVVCAGFLGEVYTKIDMLSVALALVGTIGIVSFSPHQEKVGAKELEDNTKILNFWHYPGLTIYLMMIGVTLVGCIHIVRKMNKIPEGTHLSMMDTMKAALCYPVMSGCLAVMSESMTKAVGVYIAQGFTYVMEHIITISMLVVCMGIVGLACFLTVSLGAQKFDSRYFLPAYCATSSTFFGLYGVAIGEFKGHPPFSSFMFGVFGLVAISSVVMGSMHSQTSKDEQIENQVTHHQSLSDVADYLDEGQEPGQAGRRPGRQARANKWAKLVDEEIHGVFDHGDPPPRRHGEHFRRGSDDSIESEMGVHRGPVDRVEQEFGHTSPKHSHSRTPLNSDYSPSAQSYGRGKTNAGNFGIRNQGKSVSRGSIESNHV